MTATGPELQDEEDPEPFVVPEACSQQVIFKTNYKC